MKILLDESLPRKLRNDFGSEHEVWTVRDKKWLGKKNGELLRLVIGDGFDVFVTVDRNLPYQQNMEMFPFAIIVLCAKNNRRETLRRLLPKLFELVGEVESGTVTEISE